MAGRQKIKCYEYNQDGKYIQEYESIQDVRNKYFATDIGKRPLFKTGQEDYFKLGNGNFIANYKIGREKLRKSERIRNCVFCNESGHLTNLGVEIFNLKGDKIAEFKNEYIASKMTGISQKTVWGRLNASTSKFKNKPNKDNLEFKYKTIK